MTAGSPRRRTCICTRAERAAGVPFVGCIAEVHDERPSMRCIVCGAVEVDEQVHHIAPDCPRVLSS